MTAPWLRHVNGQTSHGARGSHNKAIDRVKA